MTAATPARRPRDTPNPGFGIQQGTLPTPVATTRTARDRWRREAALGDDQPPITKNPGSTSGAWNARAATIRLAGDNRSMTLADAQQQLLLERLREAGDEAVAFAELHAAGIAFPAAVVSELELNGYAIERVHDHGRPIGVRLLKPEPPDAPASRWRRHR